MNNLGKFNKQSVYRTSSEVYCSPFEGKACPLPSGTATLELDAVAPLRVFTCKRGGDVIYRHTTDVFLLLHKKDVIERMGPDIKSYFGEPSKASVIQQTIDGMTDEQIFDSIRSRYIQSPAELKAWSEMMLDEAKALKAKAQTLIEEESARVAEEQAKLQTQSASSVEQKTD